ncbi:hypothetical protein [Rhodohalobacter mucosus]|uniref:Carboxypeptidase regulatory-like domain-containing protein n=1 Tax=Rhodohalobacter mucosus TaxID=2079485 RepID=A0A316TP00_9BACT|nr:hypothetical protein [Rhodohalobacter mucosus]PWN05508.1 hypothetical protein DDZ15_12940 [Rhodohalobacter mucosus]
MKVRGIFAFMALIISATIFITACESSVDAGFEESIAPYLELEAIEGANNTTITIRRGTSAGMDSYFAFDISNVSGNSTVSEGLTEGWCMEWQKPIQSNGDTHVGIEAFSTYGSEEWKPVNYLMSIKNKLQREDPTLTYREIQVSLWSLIENPKFDLDQVLADGRMPSDMMTDGQPNFSIEKVKSIVNHVRSNYTSYTYSENAPYLVYARTDDSSQNGGFLTCDNPDTEFCEGFYTISGNVFIDANEDKVKNTLESGAQNVTVSITDSHGNRIGQTTSSTGDYSFAVYTGETDTEYTIEVLEMTDDPDDFNEGLFTNYTPTTPIVTTVTISSENISDINFGFSPQIEKMIEQFEDETILLDTKSPEFWRKQMLLARNSVRVPGRGNTGRDIPAMEISSEELFSYLIEIENLLLEKPFQFGANRFQAAFDILNLPENSIDNRLLIELLTAELNIVSGRGSGNPDFDLALIAFGESVAAELFTSPEDGILRPNSVSEILKITSVASLSSTEDTVNLLSSFNRSGTGGGGVGTN